MRAFTTWRSVSARCSQRTSGATWEQTLTKQMGRKQVTNIGIRKVNSPISGRPRRLQVTVETNSQCGTLRLWCEWVPMLKAVPGILELLEFNSCPLEASDARRCHLGILMSLHGAFPFLPPLSSSHHFFLLQTWSVQIYINKVRFRATQGRLSKYNKFCLFCFLQ